MYPELVIHGADGRIDGVRYEELAPLLLNQVQRQQSELIERTAESVAQDRRLAEQERRNDAQAKQIAALTATVERQTRAMRDLGAQIAQLNATGVRIIYPTTAQ